MQTYKELKILFCIVECETPSYPCHGLDSHAHFRNFPTAMLTLFRVATGDNWNTIFMVYFSHKYLSFLKRGRGTHVKKGDSISSFDFYERNNGAVLPIIGFHATS